MPATSHKTLFEVLGVRPEATNDEVERAFAGFHFGLNPVIPQDVEDAYRFLQTAERRAWYREILRACNERELLNIPPDKLAEFKWFCAQANITVYPHPKAADAYVVRLPGQAQPRWTADARPVGEPGPRIPPLRERLWGLFESVVLLGAIRRASLAQKFGFVLLYCVVIAAGAYGLRWAGREWASVRAANLAAMVKSRHVEAIEKLTKLEARAKAVDDEFTAATGATFDPATGKSTKPRPEVDETIFRHETVREAWAAIESGRVKPADLQNATDTLAAIGDRIRNHTFIPDDRDRIEDILGWIDRSASKQAGQSRYIKHIKTMVETDQFEKVGQSAERSGS